MSMNKSKSSNDNALKKKRRKKTTLFNRHRATNNSIARSPTKQIKANDTSFRFMHQLPRSSYPLSKQ